MCMMLDLSLGQTLCRHAQHAICRFPANCCAQKKENKQIHNIYAAWEIYCSQIDICDCFYSGMLEISENIMPGAWGPTLYTTINNKN